MLVLSYSTSMWLFCSDINNGVIVHVTGMLQSIIHVCGCSVLLTKNGSSTLLAALHFVVQQQFAHAAAACTLSSVAHSR
jgi:hypothetical protein